MPQTVRGVIARAKGEPVTVENIVIPDPGPGEVIVDIEAAWPVKRGDFTRM